MDLEAQEQIAIITSQARKQGNTIRMQKEEIKVEKQANVDANVKIRGLDAKVKDLGEELASLKKLAAISELLIKEKDAKIAHQLNDLTAEKQQFAKLNEQFDMNLK